jgi:hypothetical protein
MYWFATDELASTRIHAFHVEACRDELTRTAQDNRATSPRHRALRPRRTHLRLPAFHF